MTRCGYVEYGEEYISFYVKYHIAHLDACSGPKVARISETRAFVLIPVRLLTRF